MLSLKLVLFTILLFVIPISVSILILWIIRKRNYPSSYRLLALVPMIFLCYGLYTGIAKPYRLYEKHFEEITGFELPSSTEFIDYTDWGYGTRPQDNNSLFHIKVDADFYEQLKSRLSLNTNKIRGIKDEYAYRFHDMFGSDFEDRLDFHYAEYGPGNELLSIVGFIEEDRSLLVFSWKE